MKIGSDQSAVDVPDPTSVDPSTLEGAAALFGPLDPPLESSRLLRLSILFWLVETVRPRLVVQLGLSDGTIHSVLYQAVKTLDHGASCHGIDSTSGPVHGKATSGEGHASASQLRANPVLDAANDYDEASIDLLVVNAEDEPDIVNLVKHWRPRLSRRGVVVLHGAEERSLRALDFLSMTRINAIGGLVVAAAGDTPGLRGAELTGLQDGAPGHALALWAFERLGAMFAGAVRDRPSPPNRGAEVDTASLARVERRAETLQGRLGDALRTIAELRATVGAHRSAEAAVVPDTESVEAERKLALQVTAHRAEIDMLTSALSRQRETTIALEKQLEEAGKKLQKSRKRQHSHSGEAKPTKDGPQAIDRSKRSKTRRLRDRIRGIKRTMAGLVRGKS